MLVNSLKLQGRINDSKKVTSEKLKESDRPVGLKDEDVAMSPGV